VAEVLVVLLPASLSKEPDMPFQPMNYANIAPQGNPFIRDLVDNLASGYKSGQMPAQMDRKRQQEEIANAFQKLLLEEEPQKFKSQLGATGLSNALKKLQMEKIGMELDPNKKAAYIQQLASAFGQGGEGSEGSGTGNTGDLRQQLVRKALGLSGQTPQEKYDQELDLFRQKQKIKTGGDFPTTATITANQKTAQAIDNVLPLLGQLKKLNEPGQFIGKYLHPDEQAMYKTQSGLIVDSLMNAFKLPALKESFSTIQEIGSRFPLESHKNYLKRIELLEKDLKEKRKNLSSGSSGSSASSGSGNRLKFNPATGGFD
jgi:hypothetical protein